MPTPFMHLEIAERIRTHDRLDGAITQKLNERCPAFYLGNIAADFQTISNIPREATHFYQLPPEKSVLPYKVMLERYPQLANAALLPQEQAMFIAGYLAHLLLDLRWYWDVLIPYFSEGKDWPVDHRQRFLVHNTLLTYLDKVAFELLPSRTAETLAAAQPDNWLPFASDGDLIRWRDMLVRQLQPGATRETIKIYAKRMRMEPEVFAANLDDSQWMHEQVFRKVPLSEVQAIIADAVEQSVVLIRGYLTET